MSVPIAEFVKSALLNAGVLMPVILGIVTYAGRLGVQGRAQLIVSLAAGFVLGIAAQISSVGLPSTFADGFALFLYGLMPGLIASGVYETGKELIYKGARSSAPVE